MVGEKSGKRKYSHSQRLLDKRLGLLLMVSIAAMIFGIAGIPSIRVLYLNFANKMVGVPEQFIGFDNYLALFGDKIYWKSPYNTIIYTVGCITAKLVLGLLPVVILNQKFGGKAPFRTTLLIPWVSSGMVAVTTWRWMYNSTYGVINSLLLRAGLIGLPIPRLNNPDVVLLNTVLVNAWGGIPFFMFSLLGALQTLDGQIFEATYVDEVSMSRCFQYITLPGISSVLGISILLSAIWTFNDFENIFLITGDGPIYSSSIISTCTYDLVFMQNSFGRALSVAVSVIPLMVILILVSQEAVSRNGVEQGRR